MGDPFESGMMATGGCATGFLWSVVAGHAKLSTGKGWGRALISCAGSALNAFTIYSVTDHFSKERDLARGLTLSWFGAQAAAGFTNWLGRRYQLENKAAFNAFAFPLNYASAPLISTAGLVWAGIGEAATGFKGEVHLYGGMLVFDHKLCAYDAANTGAIGHCFPSNEKDELPQHEKAHEIQVSILGDAGILGVVGVDFLARIFSFQWKTLGESPGHLTLEPWADDYATEATPKHVNLIRRVIR
jgi:hypothetical protein